MSLLWLSAQPEGPAQNPALPPLGTLAAPRRPGQHEELTRQVFLLGARAHLTAPVIGKLAGLIWMHVIHLFSSRGDLMGMPLTAEPPNEIASRRLLPDCR